MFSVISRSRLERMGTGNGERGTRRVRTRSCPCCWGNICTHALNKEVTAVNKLLVCEVNGPRGYLQGRQPGDPHSVTRRLPSHAPPRPAAAATPAAWGGEGSGKWTTHARRPKKAKRPICPARPPLPCACGHVYGCGRGKSPSHPTPPTPRSSQSPSSGFVRSTKRRAGRSMCGASARCARCGLGSPDESMTFSLPPGLGLHIQSWWL
jgi:hypothetical protein